MLKVRRKQCQRGYLCGNFLAGLAVHRFESSLNATVRLTFVVFSVLCYVRQILQEMCRDSCNILCIHTPTCSVFSRHTTSVITGPDATSFTPFPPPRHLRPLTHLQPVPLISLAVHLSLGQIVWCTSAQLPCIYPAYMILPDSRFNDSLPSPLLDLF